MTLEPTTPGVKKNGYRGRVRTGCQTCRSRKVKCDESRPVCNNCARLRRHCEYRAPVRRQGQTNQESVPLSPLSCGEAPALLSLPNHTPQPISSSPEDATCELHVSVPWRRSEDPFRYPDSSAVEVTAQLEETLRERRDVALASDESQAEVDLASTLVSRDIELTTTMDLLAARGEPSQLTAFFADEVDCPGITPFDPLNWKLAKLHIVGLSSSCPAIAVAITAVSSLYKAQLFALSVSKPLAHYHSAKSSFDELLNDPNQDFSRALVVAFLLCAFELILSDDTVPTFKEPGGVFIERLEAWAQRPATHSVLSVRLITWLKIIQTITMRGGGLGLLAEGVQSLLPVYDDPIPNMRPPSDHQPDLSNSIYEVLSPPIFDFYFRLQMLSGEIARLTHYHRSRTTGIDQDEVTEQIVEIKARLRNLWESRSTTQCQSPKHLRPQLAPRVADMIITLVGICDAAYHAEFVEIDRVMGDPVSKWTDSRDAIQAIREIVDGDGNGCHMVDGDRLNPGFLRPLFLVAIESMDQEQNSWAVEKIASIRSPIYRSDFFSAFGRALSDAQMRKERRVTSKYFCIWYFGVPPPYM